MDSDIFTLKELSNYLKISELSVYRLLKIGKIPAFKVGQQWRFKKPSIDRWIDKKIEENNNYHKKIV